MQCSLRLDRDRNCGNVKMKTINNKNPYQKEPNLDIDELAIRLQHIKREGSPTGMPIRSIEQAEAVRRYYAAFPALKKDETSPLQYSLPPPAWCRKPETIKMQSDLISKDWKKKIPTKERRNSYQGQRKNKKRCNAYGRSFESKELPEWFTHEGIWDMEVQDPVGEFIRAIALDEGYGTAENTVTDDTLLTSKARAVPHWENALELGEWVVADEPPPRPPSPSDEELYARFEAKFDRSIEALWARDQNTPDDEYQELPIDFAELLSSPSDGMFAPPPPPPRFLPSPADPSSLPSLGSLADSVWACEAPLSPPLHDRLRPLHLATPPPPPPVPPPELESFALYDGDELYEALATVADTVRSLTAINHSRDASGFCEVPPRRRTARPPAASPPPRRVEPESDPSEREDPLTAARTHFRPIEREPEAEAPRYADGDTFDIRGTPDAVEYRRSASGGSYVGEGRYLECRGEPSGLRFAVRQSDAAVQTDAPSACDECAGAAKKMRPAGAVACICAVAPAGAGAGAAPPVADEMSRDWEELLADISAAHAHYAAAPVADEEGGCDRKRRHSAALRCARHCAHPHARFLPCAALDRPLTR